MTLSSEQEDRVVELFKERADINWITQTLFDDLSLDGRNKEGRLVKDVLTKRGLKYQTTSTSAKKQVKYQISDEQKALLMSDQVTSEMLPIEIARLAFNDEGIKPLSTEHRAVIKFLEEFRPDVIDEGVTFANGKWNSPKSIQFAIRKINKWCDVKLKEDPSQLHNKHRRYAEKLLEYLNIYKLNQTINSFKTDLDRNLFESEFIRATWDKPDLTVDEINLYMMICSNYVRAVHIQKRIDQFNLMLESEELESGEITIRLTEQIKATNDELNACEKRIESLTQKLNGSRADRLKNQGKHAGTMIDLVVAFQEREERDRLILMAEKRLEVIDKEVDRLESLDEYKARIFGVDREEVT